MEDRKYVVWEFHLLFVSLTLVATPSVFLPNDHVYDYLVPIVQL
jgi:hypothetical protein